MLDTTVSLFITAKQPIRRLTAFLVENGVLKKGFGLGDLISNQTRLSPSTYLFQLSINKLEDLQMRQGIPFGRFEGESVRPFEPKNILVVSKDSGQTEHIEALNHVLSTLKKLGIGHQMRNMRGLDQNDFEGWDLIVPIGGDGTFLRACHFIANGTPVFGIISNPQTIDSNPLGSWGHYMLIKPEETELAFNLMYRGNFELAGIRRLKASLIRGAETTDLSPALNELSIREQDFTHTSRYFLSANGLREQMTDSGLIVSTGSGSLANSWAFNEGSLSFSPTSEMLQFKVLAPRRFLLDGSERKLLHGFSEKITVESAMRFNPVISIDCAEKHPFPDGAKLEIGISDSLLNFAVFPTISQKKMSSPERPEAEVVSSSEAPVLSADQIREVDSLPISSTVPPQEKRQILLLKIDPKLTALHVAGILKTGGIPLAEKDIQIEATISNPTLLFPTAEIAALPAVARDVALGLYSYGLRVTEFAGTIVEHDSSIDKDVWAPSIDTIAFIKAMMDNGVLGGHIRSAAEVGTGAGAIAKAIVQNSPGLNDLVVTDINRKSIECCVRNLQPVIGKVDLHSIWGQGIKNTGKVDLLAVNPPYLPEKKTSGEVDQYRGLGLIEEVLRDGKKHLNAGGSIVINYSSCAAREFKRWVKGYGWRERPLYDITVPLKIVRVYKDPVWLEFMLKHGGLEVRDEIVTGYRFWHTLNIVQLTRANGDENALS